MKYFFVLTLLCFGLMAQAQPQKINYQAVAVNASGVTVKNRVISLKLSILDSSSTGSVLYSETHQPTTDGSGQFNVFLGGGTAVSGTFSNIPWGNTKDKFLKAEADLNGGTSYVLIGVSQVVSVPYALAAGSLNDSSKVTANDGTEWSLIVGPNGPVWQQSSGPGGLKMNYPCPGFPTVTYGGQTYNTVQIGSQCWFKENLNMGTMIQGSSNQTNNGIIEKYCYNNLLANCDTFGGLYQWAEAVQYQNGASNTSSPNPAFTGNVKGICPTGWHVPSRIEVDILDLFLGGSSISGGLLKTTNNYFFNAGSNIGASNLSGFTSIGAGYRDRSGQFGAERFETMYRLSTQQFVSGLVFNIRTNFYNTQIVQFSSLYGFSVRCLKD
jgi:uncharacterized protein (TIGR02145 family)